MWPVKKSSLSIWQKSLFRTITKNVLVINSGSSSIKCQVVNPISRAVEFHCVADRLKSSGEKDLPNGVPKSETHQEALRRITKLLSGSTFAAIGHRVVHGGSHFQTATLIDNQVIDKIEACSLFAPLHNPNSLVGIKLLMELFPKTPQVAVFDTSFHQTMPEKAFRYAIPEAIYQEADIRKFGFHGHSHKYVIGEAARRLEREATDLRAVSAHLGNGCSVTASVGGRCVDTSMGLTPLEGLVMGQRSGDVDASIFLVLKNKYNFTVEQTLEMLNSKSGFVGLTGISDARAVEELYRAGNKQALLAVDIFCYRLAKYIASYLVPLGRLDALIFTGEIGENSWLTRQHVLNLLSRPLGFLIDDERNKLHGEGWDGVITAQDTSGPLAMVVKTNEELMIAAETLALVTNYIP